MTSRIESQTYTRPGEGQGQPSPGCRHEFRWIREIHERVCIKCGLVHEGKTYAPRAKPGKPSQMNGDDGAPTKTELIAWKVFNALGWEVGINLDRRSYVKLYRALIRTFKPETDYQLGGIALLAYWMLADGKRNPMFRGSMKRIGKRYRYYRHYVEYRRELNR